MNDDDLVISYEDWKEDPINEGKDFKDYIDEVCYFDNVAWLREEIAYWESEYIRHKGKPEYQKFDRETIENFKKALKKALDEQKGEHRDKNAPL